MSAAIWFQSSLVALSALAFASSGFANAQEAAPAELSPTRVNLTLQAKDLRGPWIVTLSNESSFPVRVAADARQLSFRIRTNGAKSYVNCALPSAMRPFDGSRSLVLAAGERYEEKVDPTLFCFGPALDAMGPDTSVTAFLGWKPDPKKEKSHKPQNAPFVAEPTGNLDAAAIKQVASQTVWLGGASPEDTNKQDDSSERGAAKIVVKTNRRTDASALRDASLTVTLRNVGDKSGLLHMRTDDLVFQVRGPDGQATTCGGPHLRAVARDFFHTLRPGSSETMTVLLGEVCPRRFFATPGVYEVSTVFRASETGEAFGFNALTGRFVSLSSTLVRLQTARFGYYQARPETKR